MAGVDPAAESRRLWRLAGMGGTLTSEILAGTLIGWGLDTLFDTGPTLLIILTIGGVVVGMTTFIRTATRESRRAAQEAAGIRPVPAADESDNDGRADGTADTPPPPWQTPPQHPPLPAPPNARG